LIEKCFFLFVFVVFPNLALELRTKFLSGFFVAVPHLLIRHGSVSGTIIAVSGRGSKQKGEKVFFCLVVLYLDGAAQLTECFDGQD
jgi:hypothetical protein